MNFVTLLIGNPLPVAVKVPLDQGLQVIHRFDIDTRNVQGIVVVTKSRLYQADPGFILALRQRQLPGEFLYALVSYTGGEGHGQGLGMLRVHELPAAPGGRQIQEFAATESRYLAQFAIQKLLAGIGVFPQHCGHAVGRDQHRTLFAHRTGRPIQVDAIDTVEAIGDRPTQHIGHSRVRTQAQYRCGSPPNPFLMLGLLAYGVHTHATVINIGAAGSQAVAEDIHLKTGEGGNRVDAKVRAPQQRHGLLRIGHIQFHGFSPGVREGRVQLLHAFARGIGDHQPRHPAG